MSELTAIRTSDGAQVKAKAVWETSVPVWADNNTTALHGFSLCLRVDAVEGRWEEWFQKSTDSCRVNDGIVDPAPELIADAARALKEIGYEIDLKLEHLGQ